VVNVTAAAGNEELAERAVEAAFAEFRRLDALLSHYSDHSEVGRLNRRPAGPSAELQDSKS
jgi:thiamine biosynthesis lipoprotein ApbE